MVRTSDGEERGGKITSVSPFPFTVRRFPYDDRKGAEIWPNGARMAMFIYTCPEEWEWGKKEPLSPPGTYVVPGEPSSGLSTRSAVNFGFEVGLRRLRDIFKQHDMKMTLATTGNACELHPEIIKELSDLGHEIAAHGFSEGTPPSFLSREEQRKDIENSLSIIMSLTGKRPKGWWSPAALCDANTIELLAEAGLLYHGDLQDDELPYFIDTNAGTIVEIPYNMVVNVNDFFVFITARRSTSENLAYLKSTFDAYYEAAGTTPLYMIYGTHPFVSGRPDTAYCFSKFLEYVQQKKEVWFPSYTQAAEWWQSRYGKGYGR